MKAITTTLLLLNGIATFMKSDGQNRLSFYERQYAVKYLTETKVNLSDRTQNLTPRQLAFKPSAESWSVEECIKHLLISEEKIWKEWLEAAINQPPDSSARNNIQMSDIEIMAMMENREDKAKTGEPFEPKHRPEDFDFVFEELMQLRQVHIQFAIDTEADLRNHTIELPFGTLDAYQVMLFLAAHTKRHTKQIVEIMTHPRFPTPR